jgi:hypothetical protein
MRCASGPDVARGEGRRQLGQQRLGQFGSLNRQAVDIDREIGDILPQRAHAQPAIFIDVAFAQLDEAAQRFQQIEARRHRLAGERIEHDIDPGAAGCHAHRIDKP